MIIVFDIEKIEWLGISIFEDEWFMEPSVFIIHRVQSFYDRDKFSRPIFRHCQTSSGQMHTLAQSFLYIGLIIACLTLRAWLNIGRKILALYLFAFHLWMHRTRWVIPFDPMTRWLIVSKHVLTCFVEKNYLLFAGWTHEETSAIKKHFAKAIATKSAINKADADHFLRLHPNIHRAWKEIKNKVKLLDYIYTRIFWNAYQNLYHSIV